MPLRPVMTAACGPSRMAAFFFCALPPVCWRRAPGGVDLGTAFLHHLDRKAFQEYFAK